MSIRWKKLVLLLSFFLLLLFSKTPKTGRGGQGHDWLVMFFSWKKIRLPSCCARLSVSPLPFLSQSLVFAYDYRGAGRLSATSLKVNGVIGSESNLGSISSFTSPLTCTLGVRREDTWEMTLLRESHEISLGQGLFISSSLTEGENDDSQRRRDGLGQRKRVGVLLEEVHTNIGRCI